VESMLRFARRPKSDAEPVDLAACARDSILLFEVLLKTHPKVRFSIDLPQTLGPVMADANQIQQVLLNLLGNALQALPNKEGELQVSGGQRGAEVFVSVIDHGTGIRPEHLQQIFEPFFTTKPSGEGTGFGLAIARGLVEAHGGRIEVKTELGVGSTFTVVFPVTSQQGKIQ
jgi:two-component system, NtrC family, sensor kinase